MLFMNINQVSISVSSLSSNWYVLNNLFSTSPAYLFVRVCKAWTLTMMGEGRDASSSMQTTIAFWWKSSSIFIAWSDHTDKFNFNPHCRHTNAPASTIDADLTVSNDTGRLFTAVVTSIAGALSRDWPPPNAYILGSGLGKWMSFIARQRSEKRRPWRHALDSFRLTQDTRNDVISDHQLLTTERSDYI